MSYQLYRNTTIGNALQDALDILVLSEQLTNEQASKILLQFDKSINRVLATTNRSYVSFKAGKLGYYRFCDNVWTFKLKDVEFRGTDEEATFYCVKVVACDGKKPENIYTNNENL
ncbi:hypothetical protein G9C98_002083 [Cotesia typhae]|uniref:Transcription initiation factor IIA subunit 2 n=1 Tax=Cotesia typhae TaxID=2053667 RepID=A0A8J5R711_9HYME|nr:hypothetical protein G9C98_002083 [Cotesia typhae]